MMQTIENILTSGGEFKRVVALPGPLAVRSTTRRLLAALIEHANAVSCDLDQDPDVRREHMLLQSEAQNLYNRFA